MVIVQGGGAIIKKGATLNTKTHGREFKSATKEQQLPGGAGPEEERSAEACAYPVSSEMPIATEVSLGLIRRFAIQLLAVWALASGGSWLKMLAVP